MKKFMSMILVLVLVVALAVPAFATEIGQKTGSDSKDVEAGYTAPKDNEGAKVYRIVISWEATEEETALTYTGKNSTYTWDTTDLVYKETVNNESAIGWAGAAGYKISVTNYSNDDISAETSASNDFNLTLTEPEAEAKKAKLESAAKGIEFNDTKSEGKETSAEFTYKYSAVESAKAPDGTEDATISVGKITVEIKVG